jgi:hypothetical protein
MTADSSEQAEVEDHLRRQIDAYHEAALAYAAVKLGLIETMGSRAWPVGEIATELGLSQPHLLRFLRGLATLGLCEERSSETFALTQAGQSLAPGSPTRLREKLLIVVEQYWQPWANLGACLKTGTPAFDQVFSMAVADWRRDHPDHGAVFEAYLGGETFAHAAPIVEMLHLAGMETVAEIGGGHGALLAAVLLAHPHLTGVLMDAPHKLAGARVYLQSHGLTERVGLVRGDATVEVPVAADLYLLKGVLQQWDDEQAGTILRNCRKAMPDGARLVIIERQLPERAADDPAAVMLDLHMMVITGGRARSRADFEALLSQSDLKLSNVTTTTSGLYVLTALRH